MATLKGPRGNGRRGRPRALSLVLLAASAASTTVRRRPVLPPRGARPRRSRHRRRRHVRDAINRAQRTNINRATAGFGYSGRVRHVRAVHGEGKNVAPRN